MNHQTLLPALAVSLSLLVAAPLVGCKDKKSDDGAAEGGKATAEGGEKGNKKSDKKSVPTERAAIALDEGGNQIPATIAAPKGSTIFADTPTSLRVDYGNGDAFSVRVTEGNEFNTNLEEFATELAKNKYSSTNEIIEQTPTLLRYKMTTDGHTTHKFTLLHELGGKTWVCSEGLYGGWSAEDAAAQLEVCKTLAAK